MEYLSAEQRYERDILYTKEIIDKCISRCYVKPKYKIIVYLKSKCNRAALLKILELPSFYNNGVCQFPNGSEIKFVPISDVILNEQSHMVIIDHDIRQKEIDTKIKPLIIPYTTDSGDMQINPKLIYINFKMDKNLKLEEKKSEKV